MSTDLSMLRLLDARTLADPYPFYRSLREQDPVHWDRQLHSWVLTRYSDVQAVLHRFSSNTIPSPEQMSALGCSAMNPIVEVLNRQMAFMDAPAHTRLRTLAAAAFAPRRVEVLRAHVQEICEGLIAGVRGQGHLELMADYAGVLPAIVTAEMLGVPASDWKQLKQWANDFGQVFGFFQLNPGKAATVQQAIEEMTLYFRAAIRESERRPNEGLVCSLMQAEIDGARLSEEEVVANSIIVLLGGQSTVINLIGNGTLNLLRHPAELDRLRRDPSLMPAALEELLRFDGPSQYVVRKAPEDTVLGGNTIRKGQSVIAGIAAANRDPGRFPDPDRFDLDRKGNRHLAFGWAAHFCFGATLARIEGQIALSTLIARLPNLALADPAPVWRDHLGVRGVTALPLQFEAKAAPQLEAPMARG